MITFVSAFLDLSEDRSTLRSFDTYMNHFKKLAETGVNIHLFLNRACTWYTPFPNVHVEYIEITELSTYCTEARLPPVRTPEKDTLNFLIIMNAKPEFVARAIQSDIFSASHYYWIDFGVFHVIKDTEAAQKYLVDLSTRELKNVLSIPGCCGKGEYDYFNRICWRFCGGVFAGDRASLLKFYEAVCSEYKNVPLTWEVNLWAYLEAHGKISPEWSLADHDDSIIRVAL
jgi:hypothetical protein